MGPCARGWPSVLPRFGPKSGPGFLGEPFLNHIFGCRLPSEPRLAEYERAERDRHERELHTQREHFKHMEKLRKQRTALAQLGPRRARRGISADLLERMAAGSS